MFDYKQWKCDENTEKGRIKRLAAILVMVAMLGYSAAKPRRDLHEDTKEVDDSVQTLRCHIRKHPTPVQQFDDAGRRCWDTLNLPACWGRCNSLEISDWKFPYKYSRHPVCLFGSREAAVAVLEFCEEGAAPEARLFHYVRPITCRCGVCTSTNTSCEWLSATVSPMKPIYPVSFNSN